MKKILLSFIMLLLLGSCQDEWLDREPLDELTGAAVWDDPAYTETYVNGLYLGLFPIDGIGEYESYTNNAENGVGWVISHQIQKGELTPAYFWGGLDHMWYPDWGVRGEAESPETRTEWKIYYRELRAANIAIKNIEPNLDRNPEYKRLLAESLFFRGLKLFELTRRYGGVIILTEPLAFEDETQRSRNTFKECVNQVVADLSESVRWFDEYEQEQADNHQPAGRVTRWAALALKGRAQLTAQRWVEAAATYNTIIQNGGFELFPSYKGVFLETNENNQEVILDVQLKYPELVYTGFGISQPGTHQGWAGQCPTQNLVDLYELKDGKAWNDPTSTYYDPDNPYAGREDRFYETIMHDQGVYFGKRLETGSGINGNEVVISGVDVNRSWDVSTTGYYLGKFVDASSGDPYGTGANPANDQNVILIRFAEVLLGYAEAINEANGPAEAYGAVNRVRNRAGLPDLPGGLGQADMRERIRTERRKELCFEQGIYLYDIMRWRDADALNEPIRRAKITYTYQLDDNGEVVTDETDRKVVLDRAVEFPELETRANYLERYNFFWPIPQEEIDINPNLAQNGSFADDVQ